MNSLTILTKDAKKFVTDKKVTIDGQDYGIRQMSSLTLGELEDVQEIIEGTKNNADVKQMTMMIHMVLPDVPDEVLKKLTAEDMQKVFEFATANVQLPTTPDVQPTPPTAS